ncbi:hypothetical protein Nepgr_001064 [Nepenthes gracilis]|uniref:Uncharacterized protein n=1 Tax=Nepenthes gracilis TaxID=150966 RepID=A0AAD3RXG5_NEPGR|nr:hypothetical protein Nepgr_001064 [Nepenthes gracilis]
MATWKSYLLLLKAAALDAIAAMTLMGRPLAVHTAWLRFRLLRWEYHTFGTAVDCSDVSAELFSAATGAS